MSFQQFFTLSHQSLRLGSALKAIPLLLAGLCIATSACSRQPELIAPAAKASDEENKPDTDSATELAQNSPKKINPDGSAQAVKTPESDKSSADDGVQPASHVVDIKNPTRVQRSSLAGPAHVAKVLLTEAEKSICKVKVGDQIPEISLPNLAGETQDLSKLLGEKSTVLLFWSPTDPFSTWFLSDLTPDLYEPYQSMGLNIVGVCSGTKDDPVDTSTAQQAVEVAEAKFPILVDAEGEAISKFGSDRATRVYLLDNQGKVLWFDIEYSRTTRRDLGSALAALLEPVAAKSPAKAAKTK